MRHLRIRGITLLLVLTAAFPSAALAQVYDFEGLTLDQPLSGQDNWVHNDTAGFGLGLVQTGDFLDQSKVVTNEVASRTVLFRGNDANFSYSIPNTETAQIVEFDYQSDGFGTGGLYQGIVTLSVGTGGASLGPGFGISGIGPTNEMFYYRDGFFSEFGESVPLSVLPGDWLRIRATIDFTHDDGFGGLGSLSLSYANLSAGETTFTPIASVQNIDVHMSGLPADLNTIVVHFLQSDTAHKAQIDNVSIGANPNFPVVLKGDVNYDGVVDIFDVNLVSANWDGTRTQADANRDGIVDIFDVNLISANWSPSPAAGGAAAVPEPLGAALMALAMVGLIGSRQRVRRR